MPKTVAIGSSGVEVIHLQGLWNSNPTSLPFLQTDGIFGPKTRARVIEYQNNNDLAADGIVGPKTWGKLLSTPAVPSVTFKPCGNCTTANQHRWSQGALFEIAKNVMSGLSSFGAKSGTTQQNSAQVPTTVRSLTSAEITMLSGTYGSSITWPLVQITDGLGANGRPFTVSSPKVGGVAVQVINWGPSPDKDTMIHEMAHVWQSQHHDSPTKFMATAVANQAAAAAAQAAAEQIGFKTDFSAYAYRPGKSFGDYGAEQIAQQVERNETAIVAIVKGTPAGSISSDNTSSLSNMTAFEDKLKSGIKI